jgi:Rod binding domain-containing protein
MISGVNGLYHLKATNPALALDKTCKEFESLFAYQLLKEMGDTIPEGGLFEKSSASDMFRDMFFQSVGQAVAQTDALGIGTLVKNNERALQAFQVNSGRTGLGR